MASLSDVAVKLLEGEVAVFQYIFIRQFIATLVIAPLYLYKKKTPLSLKSSWKLTTIRANLVTIGAACMVVAVTHLPLATANAIFYAAPLLMLPIAMLILHERPNSGKVIATVIGFIGVLIVLRPSQFHWAALFALGTAITLALYHVLIRKLPSENSVLHTLFWTNLFSLPISAALALYQWAPLNHVQLAWIVASSLAILTYNGLATLAYKKSPADQIALAEYSGLIFVTLFGVWWFDEVPDLLTMLGIILIVLPLIPSKYVSKKLHLH
jgi:drug/metabolite transporter (DMT)-like permease